MRQCLRMSVNFKPHRAWDFATSNAQPNLTVLLLQARDVTGMLIVRKQKVDGITRLLERLYQGNRSEVENLE